MAYRGSSSKSTPKNNSNKRPLVVSPSQSEFDANFSDFASFSNNEGSASKRQRTNSSSNNVVTAAGRMSPLKFSNQPGTSGVNTFQKPSTNQLKSGIKPISQLIKPYKPSDDKPKYVKRPFLPGEKGQSQRPTPIDTDCDLWGSDEEGMDAILLAVSQVTTG